MVRTVPARRCRAIEAGDEREGKGVSEYKRPTNATHGAVGWRIYVNYGNGWEYEVWEDTWAKAKEQLAVYRENCPQYPVKSRRGRPE